MKRPWKAAAFTLLIAVSAAIPCPALTQPITSPPASDHPVAMVLQHPLSTRSLRSLRVRLVQRLAIPDTAVIVLAAGVLLIFLECNLPGAIIPGALGLLLVLSGIYGLALHPVRPAALLVLLAGGALPLLSSNRPLPILNILAGTTALIYGLWALIPPANAPFRVHPPVAVCVGLILGPSAFLLARIAQRARRNKVLLAAAPRATPKTFRTEGAEARTGDLPE